MQNEIQFCSVCTGIALHWNKCDQEWTARYVEGGLYCDCSDDKLLKNQKSDDVCLI